MVELATASVGREGVPFIHIDRRQEVHAQIPDLILACPFEYSVTLGVYGG